MPRSWNIAQTLTLDHKGNRSPGLHLSNILDVMCEHYQATPARYTKDPPLNYTFATTPTEQWGSNPRIMRALLGMAWEEKLFRLLASPCFIPHPAEWVVDGIAMSPDGIEVLEVGLLLHEIKLTYKSSRSPIIENRRWMWQAAGYLHAMSMIYGEPCQVVVFHPLHVTGAGKTIDPVYMPQAVAFEMEEIKTVWTEILRFKDQATPES